MEQFKDPKKRLIAYIFISYICLVISTFAGATHFIVLFSPLVTLLSFVLCYNCAQGIPEFSLNILVIGLGILCWSMGDICKLFTVYALGSTSFGGFIKTLYLFPNYLFGISIFMYIRKKMNQRNRYKLLADTFIMTIIGFILLRKLLNVLLAGRTIPFVTYVRTLGYFFVNFFMIMLAIYLLRLIKGLSIKKGTCLIPLAIFLYIIIDFQYTYIEALGLDAENIFMDLLYILFMIMMALGAYTQEKYQFEFGVRSYERNEKSKARLVMQILFLSAADIILFFIRFLSENEFFYVLIAIMGYWIMTATFENSQLDASLLESQQTLNKKLEEQVAQKTQDLKIANDNLKKLSSTDILTGLYNRRYSNSFIKNMTADYEKSGQRYAVFAIDLNHFKPINDTYGHDMGDRVLAEFGHRMLRLPKNMVGFRTGGDEFMIIQCDVINDAEVETAAKKIQELLCTPVELDTYSFNLSGSIGVSLYPKDSSNPDLLLQYADAAMYMVKASTKRDDYKYFDKALVPSVARHNNLQDLLSNAVPEDDFVLHYQPLVNTQTGRIFGAEVFPRLKKEASFEYSADELIPVAEEVGLMGKLGTWIVQTALEQFTKWNEKYNTEFYVSINLSALQLLDSGFISFLKSESSRVNYPLKKLGLDISTTVMLNADDSSKEVLIDLGNFGFKICLNDFGGGELNLSNFLDCKFYVIKLSHSLIEKADKDDNALLLAKSIQSMADTMDIKTCAVGVETDSQLKKMQDIGIFIAQGFYFGKPCDAETFENSYLNNHN
ncbi:putative bifunctional diguanylate cyclase/phosphodiesterase [Butyrivibrio sp. MB2005]|uniref:putative bifunctional diguanylate cyclase/phosphodiesterase n=1 Tax=Butyrivibrio sp. MB2005 TaxID=1280678 RepID=UPI0003FAC71D|nr:EAL domain-containing protein [Butyrivibrio sp. MB2005]